MLLNTRLLNTRRRPRRLATVASVALLLIPLACTTSTASGPYFSFVGGGNGHGVGLSQYGALGRADAGQNVVQIVAAYYPGATGVARHASTIRVKIGDVASTSLTQFGGTMVGAADGVTPIIAAGPGQSMTLSRSGGNVIAQVAGGATVNLGPTGYVGLTQGTPVLVGATGHRYRWGRLVVRPNSSGGLQLVLDQLTLEKWTDGIAEVPASWPLAAMQAQAIAARTFGAYRQAHPRNANYDVDQVAGDGTYAGYDREGSTYGSRWIQAVDSTANLILTSGGVPIQAFYSSSNGGYSETSAYVFVASLPYLQANPDPLDAAPGNAASTWTRAYTGLELGTWLRAAGRPDVGDVVGIELLGGTGASGRVDKATFRIHGSTGATELVTGNQLRAAVNAGAPAARDLLSTKFSIRGGGLAGSIPDRVEGRRQARQREADHVVVAAVDVGDEPSRRTLDPVPARLVEGLTGRHVAVDLLLGQRHEPDRGAIHERGVAAAGEVVHDRHTGEHLVASTREPTQHGRRVGGVVRLAENDAVEHHDGVGADHDPRAVRLGSARPRRDGPRGACLRRRESRHVLVGGLADLCRLVHVGHNDVEGAPEQAQELASTW